MIFKKKKHNPYVYSTLLNLSRNIFFYKELELEDTYETRIYLIFIHYSIILFIQKNKNKTPDQFNYNNLFFYIENNLRELGFGDVAVNKKMKGLNNIFYDILLKLSEKQSNFKLNKMLINKYFEKIRDNNKKQHQFELYLNNFYDFCFELSSDNMIQDVQKYKF